MSDPRDWQDGALCAQTDPELWFPGVGEPAIPAKRICAVCPVREACLDYALAAGPRIYGIWGGTTEKERRQLRTVPRPSGPRETTLARQRRVEQLTLLGWSVEQIAVELGVSSKTVIRARSAA